MEKKLLKAQQVACAIDVSPQTIGSWYKWKLENPDHELAKLLPDYIRIGNRNTRYWEEDAVWKLMEFKKIIPQGRKGVMGDVTQRYVKKNKKED